MEARDDGRVLVDPNAMYRNWLQALARSREDLAVDEADNLVEWIVSGGSEPSWGGRDSRDSFILWSQGMQINGATYLTMSRPLVREQ